MLLSFVLSFLASVALCFFLTWYIRNLALKRGWFARPDSTHHVHTAPIPRLGGVAIYLTLVTVAALLGIASSVFALKTGFDDISMPALFCGVTIVFLLGLYDDLRRLGPYLKFTVQIVAAIVLYIGGFRVMKLPLLFGNSTLGMLLGLTASVFWVLLITNAFNLLDGLDGLAAGAALFSTLTVFISSLVYSNFLVSALTLVLAGAIIGFLRFNFNPATIFLGDCGSLTIGFLLSALALAPIPEKSPTIVAVAIPLVSLGLPILETTVSVVRRFLSGQPLFVPDRQHIHHKLIERGFSHRRAVILLYGVSAACGMLSLLLLNPTGRTLGLVLLVLGVGVWIGLQHLGYHEFFELGRVAQRTIEQRQIIVNNIAIRRATQQLAGVTEAAELFRVLDDAFGNSEFDGFDFTACPAQFDAHTCEPSSLGRGLEGGLRYSRRKVGHAPGGSFTWTLNLDLMTSRSQRQGSFSVYRAYSNRPLLIDVNLLTSEFPIALADAAQRVLQHAAEARPVHGNEAVKLSPAAGSNAN